MSHPDGFEVVIECEVGSQLLRSLVPFLVAGHLFNIISVVIVVVPILRIILIVFIIMIVVVYSIEEDVEVGFSGFCNSAVLLQAHLSLGVNIHDCDDDAFDDDFDDDCDDDDNLPLIVVINT